MGSGERNLGPGRCWLGHLGVTASEAPESSALWWKPLIGIKSWGSLGIRSLSCLFLRAPGFIGTLPSYGYHTVRDMNHMFFHAEHFNARIDHWDVSNVISMHGTFQGASKFDSPLAKWNVSNVRNMSKMFCDASSFNHPVGSWNVSNVSNFAGMFQGARSFDQNLSAWSLSSDTLSAMCLQRELVLSSSSASSTTQVIPNAAAAAGDLSLSTDQLELLLQYLAYDGCDAAWYRLAFLTHKNAELWGRARSMKRPLVMHICVGTESDFKFSVPFRCASVAKIEFDFGFESVSSSIGCQAGRRYVASTGDYRVRIFPLGDAPLRDEYGPCWLDHLGLKHDEPPQSAVLWRGPIRSIESWGSLGIRSLSCLFLGATDFNGTLPSYGLHTVQDTSYMFCNASSFNQPIHHWNVSNAIDMRSMFQGTRYFNQPIERWDTRRARRITRMFCDATNFNQPLGKLDLRNVYDMDGLLEGASSFTQAHPSQPQANIPSAVRLETEAPLPPEYFEKLLQLLADDGFDAPWYRLAFLTHKNFGEESSVHAAASRSERADWIRNRLEIRHSVPSS